MDIVTVVYNDILIFFKSRYFVYRNAKIDIENTFGGVLCYCLDPRISLNYIPSVAQIKTNCLLQHRKGHKINILMGRQDIKQL